MRKGEQLPWIVSDELWARIEPLLPVVPRRPDHPGRKRLDAGKCCRASMLRTGVACDEDAFTTAALEHLQRTSPRGLRKFFGKR